MLESKHLPSAGVPSKLINLALSLRTTSLKRGTTSGLSMKKSKMFPLPSVSPKYNAR